MMSSFDALYWNALQVLAWVCLGDRALVSRCSDGTASGDRWYWTEHKVVSEGGDLHNTFVQTPSDPPTELTVALYASVLDRASVIEDAKLEIWQKLAEGSLSVTGKHKGSRVRREIALLEWCDLSIDYDKRSAVDRVSRNEVYECLMFPREAVLRLWPDVLAVEQEQPTKEGQAADARDTERFTAPNGAARPPIHAPADTGPPSAHERQASGDATPAEAAAVPAGGQAVTESAVERLAEWIFAQRPLLQHSRKLLDAACQNAGLGKFKRADFITAYKRVYASEPHAPPITGWPLREPFKSRAEEVKPPPSGRPEKPRK